MDGSHIHLLLNHFPIIGTLIATVILLWGIFQKNHAIKMLAAAVLVAMALIAIPVYLTGEPAEKKIEHLPDFTESSVEKHEDAALVALTVIELTGAVALGVFILGLRRGIASNAGFHWVAGLSLISCVLMARVGNLGGQIRHTELRESIPKTEQVYELQDNKSDTVKENATKENAIEATTTKENATKENATKENKTKENKTKENKTKEQEEHERK